MILDTVRAVADWLGNATHGVAAKLTALDYDGSDVAPTGTLTIYDETRHDIAAQGTLGTLPFLRVVAGEVRSMDGQSATYTHDADIPLEILIARAKTSPADAVRDSAYTVRATIQSLERLFDPSIAAAVTACSRNGVQLQAIQTLSAGRPDVPLTDTTVTFVVLCTIRVRDTIA